MPDTLAERFSVPPTVTGVLLVGAGVAGFALVITTSLVEAAHGALEIVQRKVFAPTPSAVTPLVGLLGVVMVPDPLTTVQRPEPTIAAFPASVAVVAHTAWSGPAMAVVGAALTVTVLVVDAVQP